MFRGSSVPPRVTHLGNDARVIVRTSASEGTCLSARGRHSARRTPCRPRKSRRRWRAAWYMGSGFRPISGRCHAHQFSMEMAWADRGGRTGSASAPGPEGDFCPARTGWPIRALVRTGGPTTDHRACLSLARGIALGDHPAIITTTTGLVFAMRLLCPSPQSRGRVCLCKPRWGGGPPTAGSMTSGPALRSQGRARAPYCGGQYTAAGAAMAHQAPMGPRSMARMVQAAKPALTLVRARDRPDGRSGS